MLLCILNGGEGCIYIFRQRHNGVVRLLSHLSWLYAPGFILNSSKLTKNKYTSSLILRAFIGVINKFQRRRGKWSFSHSENETLCAFTATKLIKSIGVDIEYVTRKPRESIITYLGNNIGNNLIKTTLNPHEMAIIVMSCMESAFKALSFSIKEDFSLYLFDVLLITENTCRLRIKLIKNEYFIANVHYVLNDRRVVSVCCVRNTDLT